MSLISRLAKDSLVYGLGGIFAKTITYFSIPVFTRLFTPKEYGNIELLILISTFFSYFVELGFDSAQSMYYFKNKKDPKTQKSIITSILQFRLIFGGTFLIISTLISPFLNSIFFKSNLHYSYFLLVFSFGLLSQILMQSIDLYRLIYKPWSYISINFIQSLLTFIFIFIFAYFLKLNIFGYILGAFLSTLIVSTLSWWNLKSYLDLSKIHHEFWGKLIKFGAPLVPSSIAIYFINSLDRWFILYFRSENELGLYSIALKFSMIIALLVNTFRQAFWPIALESMQEDNGDKFFRKISKIYFGYGCSIIIFFTYFSRWIVGFLTPPEYHDSWKIIGILSWQFFFYGFFLISYAGIWKKEKTYLNIYLTSIATFFSLVLNWILVPPFGMIGASIGTSITYLIWVITSTIVSQKYWKINYPIKDFSLIFGISLIICTFIIKNQTSEFSFILTFATFASILFCLKNIKANLSIKLIINKLKLIRNEDFKRNK